MDRAVFRQDPLAELGSAKTYQEQLSIVHKVLLERCPGIDRISVALYDSPTHSLKTFIASPIEESPLNAYDAVLLDDSELAQIGRDATPRIINDLGCYKNHLSFHANAVIGHGFASSYTHPIYHHSELAGYVFLNSFHKGYFRERVLEQADIFVHLISEMIMKEIALTRALVAAMRTSVHMVQKHDMETGNHLERMSRYARLIACTLAKNGLAKLDDEQIEQIALFAPLHDVGKIGIPDAILKKPARLEENERRIMDTHTSLGRQIVDEMIINFGFDNVPYIDYLRHISELHHEAIDGSGYPHGLIGNEIALEARIVAVSDVFDALTTQRPYKEPWCNEHAFAMLELLSIDKLDKECVSALVENPGEITKIQQQFAEAV